MEPEPKINNFGSATLSSRYPVFVIFKPIGTLCFDAQEAICRNPECGEPSGTAGAARGGGRRLDTPPGWILRPVEPRQSISRPRQVSLHSKVGSS